MNEDLQKELQNVLAKYGLKADNVQSKSEAQNSGEANASQTTPNADATVIANLADSIAEKLTKAIAQNKGYNESDQRSLRSHIDDNMRAKVFMPHHGLKEIVYPSDLSTLTKDEKIVNFFKALVYAKADPEVSGKVLRALVEGTDADGGYLVPEELRTEVFRVLPDMTVMRRIARVIPMSTDTLKLNNLSAAPVAYWTSEYNSSSTSSAELGQVSLSPNDLVCLLPVSEQLLADANINLVQFIIELFAEAIGVAEDKAFFTGSGTGQPKGISQETIATVSAGGNVNFDHILDLLDSVPQRVTQSMRAAFVGNRRTKTLLRKIKDTSGNYIWRDGGTAPGGSSQSVRLPDTLYGYPFWEQNDLGGNEIYFGDWSFYLIGDRQTVSVRTTTEGGEAWRRNAMEIKAVERVDGKAVITSPFAKLTSM